MLCAPIRLTPQYVLATSVLLLVPLVAGETIRKELGLTLFALFGLGACFGRSVGRQSWAKWKAAASLWPSKLPTPHTLERCAIINRHGLKLCRFTIRAQRPKAACVLIHGYGQSAHFEFLTAKCAESGNRAAATAPRLVVCLMPLTRACAGTRAGHTPSGRSPFFSSWWMLVSHATPWTCRSPYRESNARLSLQAPELCQRPIPMHFASHNRHRLQSFRLTFTGRAMGRARVQEGYAASSRRLMILLSTYCNCMISCGGRRAALCLSSGWGRRWAARLLAAPFRCERAHPMVS